MANTKMRPKKYTEVCGEVVELWHDSKIKALNAELVVDEMGAPLIILQDWTQENKSKDLVRLHIKDAIRLKAVFDSLIHDFHREYADSDSLIYEKYEELKKREDELLKIRSRK